MKNQVFAIFVILCFASTKVNANDDVDAIIGDLKSYVKLLPVDEEKSEKILSEIEKAREECLSDADDINPEIIKKLAHESIPAVKECAGSAINVEDTSERGMKAIQCIMQKVDSVTPPSDMTDEDKKRFEDTLDCLAKPFKG
ncbi:hypothetical protein MTO96_031444 [Rhipicephalus appendiculatus]